MERKRPSSSLNMRRARTRTLIQLGGLVEKSGLLDRFGIHTGVDLQKDEEMHSPMLQLFGALCDLHTQMQEDPHLLNLWEIKGKKGFEGG